CPHCTIPSTRAAARGSTRSRSTRSPDPTLFRSRHAAEGGDEEGRHRGLGGDGDPDRLGDRAGAGEARGERVRPEEDAGGGGDREDRKSTRLNSSHVKRSYAGFCLETKKIKRARC